MKLSVFTDRWELKAPFVISRGVHYHIETITVCLGRDGVCGRGESLGVDYLGETVDTMQAQLEAVRGEVDAGADRQAVQELLPPGGARNALDCAMWDLQAKRAGKRVHELLGTPFEPVTTAYTLSLDEPEAMAREAAAHSRFPLLKLKLGADRPVERLRAIHEARPDARLVIDANCGWSLEMLEDLAGELGACGVEMVEQPLPPEYDAALEGLDYPVALCADESCQSMADLPRAAERYGLVNIKLDKCGGLSEAMRMVRWCRENGVELMVGNMLGSSLAMAPAFLVAQYCRFVDLDGPLWQKTDRGSPFVYEGARMLPPGPGLWG